MKKLIALLLVICAFPGCDDNNDEKDPFISRWKYSQNYMVVYFRLLKNTTVNGGYYTVEDIKFGDANWKFGAPLQVDPGKYIKAITLKTSQKAADSIVLMGLTTSQSMMHADSIWVKVGSAAQITYKDQIIFRN